MESFPKPKTKPEQLPTKAEIHPQDDITPAQEPSIDDKINRTNEQGIGEDGAAPPVKGNAGDNSEELSGGPAPGSDPFANLRKKYGSEPTPSETSQLVEPQESGDYTQP